MKRSPDSIMEHQLKIDCELFPLVENGMKTCEFRFDDRQYQIDDILVLQEWQPKAQKYTGKEVRMRVTDIRAGGTYGIPDGYVLMSIIPEWNKIPMLRGIGNVNELAMRWLTGMLRKHEVITLTREQLVGPFTGIEEISPSQNDNGELELHYKYARRL